MTTAPQAEAIIDTIHRLRQQIPPAVTLIAVTKLLPVEVIRIAYDAGIRHIGESRVQEAIAKQAQLTDLPDITWHLIGHLQSNKVRKAVEHFQWIHSVDSLKLARKLDQAAAEQQKQPQCCLQVKMVPDPPKYGFDASDLPALLPELNQLTHLQFRGIMAIPPQAADADTITQVFVSARVLAETINQGGWSHLTLDQLSLGMSGDYQQAIAAGSTMVRLGTVLFGPRPQ
ncbi:YggS family pyridoxal phosphate-dependent enzyme [Nodosilinea sp. P-1105]|uniref:YggS family pyridoxal phosphate-dependent enzyme n=1 Tax=Nodosilinea sp. P-1105 TaxID=2546229 RepID=UPI00146B0F22|nr:YggS family pyridoxal phosphate-dependent enzyme [Nodosilinea sp. P-1105]NMF86120.1 YggS family pyridoxal phosphate-dependent enzyme [Nodosilinea sp. P-1105]